MRLWALGALAVGSAFAPQAALAQEAASCSRVEPSGERTLCREVVVDAPAAEVWRLISTSEGLRSWAAPVAAIDLRVGGEFESSYDPDGRIGAPGNIHNRVVAFAPGEFLVMQVAQAPPGFPHADVVGKLATVLSLEAVDATHTRVRVTMLGYREGAAFDALYQFFDAGNAYTLNKLRDRVAEGAR